MSELICLAFDEPNTADRVLNEIASLREQYLIELEDACVVVRDSEGKVHLKQAVPIVELSTASGGAWGALWGTLIGTLFLNPLAGLLVGGALGATSGALSSTMTDYGISDDFIKSLGSKIAPNSSALFLLIQKVNEDKVLPKLGGFGGHILQTSLTNEQEARLKAALESSTATTTVPPVTTVPTEVPPPAPDTVP